MGWGPLRRLWDGLKVGKNKASRPSKTWTQCGKMLSNKLLLLIINAYWPQLFCISFDDKWRGQSLTEWGIDWKDDSVTDTKYRDKSGVKCVSFQESLKLWPVVYIEETQILHLSNDWSALKHKMRRSPLGHFNHMSKYESLSRWFRW